MGLDKHFATVGAWCLHGWGGAFAFSSSCPWAPFEVVLDTASLGRQADLCFAIVSWPVTLGGREGRPQV